MLFSEMNTLLEGPEYLRMDEQYRKLMFSVLSHYAEDVEIIHRLEWKERTRGMSYEARENYRRKMDLFLFRIDRRLLAAITGLVRDLACIQKIETDIILSAVQRSPLDKCEVYLQMLAEYMKTCATRVMPSQVFEVCMSTLLHVKV